MRGYLSTSLTHLSSCLALLTDLSEDDVKEMYSAYYVSTHKRHVPTFFRSFESRLAHHARCQRSCATVSTCRGIVLFPHAAYDTGTDLIVVCTVTSCHVMPCHAVPFYLSDLEVSNPRFPSTTSTRTVHICSMYVYTYSNSFVVRLPAYVRPYSCTIDLGINTYETIFAAK